MTRGGPTYLAEKFSWGPKERLEERPKSQPEELAAHLEAKQHLALMSRGLQILEVCYWLAEHRS